eukprot:1827087-Prymnesium_polylepis.1
MVALPDWRFEVVVMQPLRPDERAEHSGDATIDATAAPLLHICHHASHCGQDTDRHRLRRKNQLLAEDVKLHESLVVVDQSRIADAQHLGDRQAHRVSRRQRTKRKSAYQRGFCRWCVCGAKCCGRDKRIIACREAGAAEGEWGVAQLNCRVLTACHRAAHILDNRRVELEAEIDDASVRCVHKADLNVKQ